MACKEARSGCFDLQKEYVWHRVTSYGIGKEKEKPHISPTHRPWPEIV